MSTSVKPTINADDILKAATCKTMGVAPDGTYAMEIASVKDRDGVAAISIHTSKAGKKYLKAVLRFSKDEEYGSYVFASPIMVEGKSASYAKNIAGLYAALDLPADTTIEVTGKSNPDKNGKTNDLVSFYAPTGEVNLAGRAVRVQLGSETDNTGKLRQTVVAFLKAE